MGEQSDDGHPADASRATVSDARAARTSTRTTVARAALSLPQATRPAIVARTGVSMPSVSRVVKGLIADGLIEEAPGVERAGAGRRSAILLPRPSLGCAVGFDFGIYLSRVVCLDMRGEVVATWEGETPSGVTTAEHAEWLVEAVEAVVAEAGMPLRWLVVSFPSRVTERDGALIDVRDDGDAPGPTLGDEVARRLRAPFRFENESVAALVAELQAMGETAPADVALVSVSQRVTAAIALRGEVLRGERHAVGMLGGLPFGDDREPVSRVVTITGIERDLDRIGRSVEGWSELVAGEVGGSASIDRIRERFVEGLVLLTAAVAGSVDPALLIFDGRVTPLIERVLPEIRVRLARVLPVVPELRLSRDSSLYSSASGAARLALDAARERLLRDLESGVPLPR